LSHVALSTQIIHRKTRRRFSAKEKIPTVLEGLRGEESLASLCRREGTAANLYYRWSKEFCELGKKRLLADKQREATSTEVTELHKENARLKERMAKMSECQGGRSRPLARRF
jgi:transposase